MGYSSAAMLSLADECIWRWRRAKRALYASWPAIVSSFSLPAQTHPAARAAGSPLDGYATILASICRWLAADPPTLRRLRSGAPAQSHSRVRCVFFMLQPAPVAQGECQAAASGQLTST